MTGPTVNMTSILDDSPVKKSSSKRDVIVEELPAGVLDSLSSADGSRSDQENENSSKAQHATSTRKSSGAAALEDLDFGKLSLSEGPRGAEKNVQTLEDSDSEHSAVGLAQHDACLADGEDFEQQVASPVPGRAPVDALEPAIELLSGQTAVHQSPGHADSESEQSEGSDGDSPGQQSGAEDLCLEAEGAMQLCLRAGLHDALYVHQVAALEWLWGLWVKGSGGILGDDMGLGKTRTMCSFLAGLTPASGSAEASIRRSSTGSKRFRRGLVVVPTTLLDTWMTELDRVGVHAMRYRGTKAQRERMQHRLFSGHKVAVTTYETILNDVEALSSCSVCGYFPEDFKRDIPAWDVIVLDEGHKVKNCNSKTYKALHRLPARMRVVVTGTPMQNNLMEMHALLDLACPGLLPDRKQFKAQASAIEAGQDKSAPLVTKQQGHASAERLHALFDPYLLRRNKSSTRLITVATARTEASSDNCGLSEYTAADTAASSSAAEADTPALPGKTDLVVWLQMHPVQKQAYQGFLGSSEVAAALNQTSSALSAITVLKKICDHPALLNNRNALKAVRMPKKQPPLKGGNRGQGSTANKQKQPRQRVNIVMSDEDSDDDFAQPAGSGVAKFSEHSDSEEGSEDDLSSLGDFVVQDSDEESASESESSDDGADAEGEAEEESEGACNQEQSDGGGTSSNADGTAADWSSQKSDNLMKRLKRLKDMHIEDSCKTVFTLKLIQQLAATGHRTLVFAQSLGMLDMLQRALRRNGMRVLRMDGQSAAVADRQKIVARFQKSKSIPVFLLSAQVGGLGLTITAADRVIILDPHWNPAVDCQSVDRAFRIGQQRHVVVYRLITCGTVEEKIYRRQVFKGGLAKATIEKANPTKYFSEVELRELFSLDVSRLTHSHTAEELHKHHSADRAYSPEITAHVASLTDIEWAVDTSDHSVLFSRADESASEAPHSQQLPLQPQGVAAIKEEDAAKMTRNASAALSAVGSTVSTGVQPPSAEALHRRKLVKRASSLEQKISEVSAALSATQGGAALADNGAKLHSALRTATDDLAATHSALSDLKSAESASGVATSAPASDPRGGVLAAGSHDHQPTEAAVAAPAGAPVAQVVRGDARAAADDLAEMLAEKATVKDDSVGTGTFDRFRYTP